MRILLVSVFGASLAFYSAGCTVHESGGVGVGVETPSVEVDAPVIEGPGVVEIDTEPPPAERVYVYDEGFPPGVYLFGGSYYYNGYRYDHDVFVNRYVKENIRTRRFVNVQENRQQGRQLEERQKSEFQKTGGRHVARNAKPAVEHQQKPAERHEPAAEHIQKPAEHPVNTPPKHENLNEHPAKPAEHPGEVKKDEHVKPQENREKAEPKSDKKDEKKEEK